MEQNGQMNLLILGGSYFLGLAFAEHAFRAGHRITVLNRGSRPLGSSRIREYHADRRDIEALKRFPGAGSDFGREQNPADAPDPCRNFGNRVDKDFDAIVDFCGYQQGDIRLITEHLNASFRQYIFISTIDVLRHGCRRPLREEAPYEDRDFGGEAGAYIRGKIALEQELIALSGASLKPYNAPLGIPENPFPYTILRPSFLFGPGNYAPRESVFFQWIAKAGQILYPADADGLFGMVYVEDTARAILLCCQNPDAYGKIFHLCHPQVLTYSSFSRLLRDATGQEFTEIPVTRAQVLEAELPLPFPLTKEESAVCDGRRIRGLGFSYSDLTESLRETWEAFRKSSPV